MTLNRLALSCVVLVYLAIASHSGSVEAAEMLAATGPLFAVYQALSLALFAHILWKPAVSPARRICGIALDVVMFSYCMYAGGETTAPFFPFYLWIIFGNGFRFGNQYLLISAGAGIALFSVVALLNPYWQTHRALAIGFIASLIFLPFYVSILIRKLSAAKRQAEEASRAKSAFLASISHELRTPLNAIIGLGSLLSIEVRSAEHRRMLQTVVNSGRSLLSLINNILDFARIESGRMPSNVVDVELDRTISAIDEMLSVQAKAKGISLNFHVSTRVPSRIRVDLAHIEQILVNLVSNAIKFTDRGFVTVSVDVSEASGDRIRLRFEVADTGIGIAAEAQARIFESFTQANASIIDRYGGTGLGLAICKQLVEFLGGQIGLTSTLGSGSVFWFEVPVERLDSPPVSVEERSIILISKDPRLQVEFASLGVEATVFTSVDEAMSWLKMRQGQSQVVAIDHRESLNISNEYLKSIEPLKESAGGTVIAIVDLADAALPPRVGRYFSTSISYPLVAHEIDCAMSLARARGDVMRTELDAAASPPKVSRPLSILLAEDNPTNQLVIGKILEQAGHRSTIVGDGQEALEALLDGGYDLGLLDVNMPVMNGIEVAKLYRFATLGLPTVPLIALTADATPEMQEGCKTAGFDICATKPIEPAQLIGLIESLATESETPAAADHAAAGVTEIASHPKFRYGQTIDEAVLENLEKLGGADFVAEVKAQFLIDSAKQLREAREAFADGDVEKIKYHLHALRSTSANIGAQRLHDLCLTGREMSFVEHSERGKELLEQIAAELLRVRLLLERNPSEVFVKPIRLSMPHL